MSAFSWAKERYAAVGVDVEAAIVAALAAPISLHCWQGDDVRGFLFGDAELSGGIMATGSHPGRAGNADELRALLTRALALLPGAHKLNLHAIYADTDQKVDLPDLRPEHFAPWVDFARAQGLGLDFNPTCFSHPMAASGLTLSHPDPAVADFWSAHLAASRAIAADFAAKTGQECALNYWFPDGSKEPPADPMGPRERMRARLDAAITGKLPGVFESLEGKVFGIGAESYTVVTNDFSSLYAATRGIGLTIDMGHYHPTEEAADKLTSLPAQIPGVQLHLSRGVRWDSDHVLTQSDALLAVFDVLCGCGLLPKTRIGLDYFDASVDRAAAWVCGARAARCGLLRGLLTPHAQLRAAEAAGDTTRRLIAREVAVTLPFAAVWQELCDRAGVPVDPWEGLK